MLMPNTEGDDAKTKRFLLRQILVVIVVYTNTGVVIVYTYQHCSSRLAPAGMHMFKCIHEVN